MKRNCKEKFSDVNDTLLELFWVAKVKNIPLSETLIKEKDIQIEKVFGFQDFCANKDWLQKFCNFNNIAFKLICGGPADVGNELYYKWKMRLSLIFAR